MATQPNGGPNVKCDTAATEEPLFLSPAVYGFTAHHWHPGAFFTLAVSGDVESDRMDWRLVDCRAGAADGVLTKRILGRMRADASLEAFEIQPNFVHQLRKIDDRRLHVMDRSAEEMARDYDVVFSCLPLLSIPVKVSIRILQQARQRLRARGGTLVLFQYSHLSEKLLSRYFHWKRVRVVRNFPPALVYICTPR
ncbi:Phospholipid N-methyltransferase [Serratia plymuthica]|nr:Phospholipid N-methyltransferase [Serratia plymuthica]